MLVCIKYILSYVYYMCVWVCWYVWEWHWIGHDQTVYPWQRNIFKLDNVLLLIKLIYTQLPFFDWVFFFLSVRYLRYLSNEFYQHSFFSIFIKWKHSRSVHWKGNIVYVVIIIQAIIVFETTTYGYMYSVHYTYYVLPHPRRREDESVGLSPNLLTLYTRYSYLHDFSRGFDQDKIENPVGVVCCN